MSAMPFHAVTKPDYGTEESAMSAYRSAGTERAMQLENRGPLRFTAAGALDPAIEAAYARYGFYVFESVLSPAELADIEADLARMVERLPAHRGGTVDQAGRPALGADCQAPNVIWVKPLSDPLGGTSIANGRHPSKMFEPPAPADAPREVVQLVLGSLQFSDACLRLYGHPTLLRAAAAINGDDFTPFNEAVWIKHPRLGGSVAWHQDGWTHWQNPELDEGTHGFNFMAQLYGCDAENGLWIVPGSHRLGKVDIGAMVEAAGCDRLTDAVPLLCNAGDVAICNRQAVHGSFANTSDRPRVTLNFGFHRRASVLGVRSGGVHNKVTEYDDARIRERSKMIMYAIDARAQRYPEERAFEYAPLKALKASLRFDAAARGAYQRLQPAGSGDLT